MNWWQVRRTGAAVMVSAMCLLSPGGVLADWPAVSPWQQLGRWSGYSWGDGYHAQPRGRLLHSPMAPSCLGAPGGWMPGAGFASIGASQPVAVAGAQGAVAAGVVAPGAGAIGAGTPNGLLPAGPLLGRHQPISRDPAPYALPGVAPDEPLQPSIHYRVRTALTGQ